MAKVLDLLTDALIEIGAIAVGETAQAADIQFALRTLNRMLAVWSTEDLTVYTITPQVFPLVSGKQVYTIGAGGDFNTPRPVKIPMVSVLQNPGASNELEIPVSILTDEEWQGVAMKQTPSVFPVYAWITGDVPLNNIYFWPVPGSAAYSVKLYAWGLFTTYTQLTTVMSFPNGYEEAILSNLAIMLCPSYGLQPSTILGQRALVSKNAIQSLNVEPVYAYCDPALSHSRGQSLAVQTQGLLIDP